MNEAVFQIHSTVGNLIMEKLYKEADTNFLKLWCDLEVVTLVSLPFIFDYHLTKCLSGKLVFVSFCHVYIFKVI